MKRFAIAVLFIMITTPSFAKKPVVINNIHNNTYNTYSTTNVTNISQVSNVYQNPNRFGTKLDMPNLIHIKGGWYAGVEGGKDLNYTDSSEGWFSYMKLTWTGSLFDFDKK